MISDRGDSSPGVNLPATVTMEGQTETWQEDMIGWCVNVFGYVCDGIMTGYGYEQQQVQEMYEHQSSFNVLMNHM